MQQPSLPLPVEGRASSIVVARPVELGSAADLDDFFENGAVPLHLVGPDGIILRANKAELALLGYDAADYVGRPVADFHADTSTIGDILSRLTRGETLHRYPARLRAKDGSIKHVEITSSVNRRNGEFINTRCFSFDVTALREAEARVSDQQTRFEQILDALPAAVYTTDAAGKITYFNPAAERLAGRRPEIGKDEWCVTWRLRDDGGRPLPHDVCPMAVALKENRPVRGLEAFAERPDGKLVPFKPHPTPLYDAAGTMTGAVNMLIDLTEEKARQAHIEFVMRELSHRSKNLLAVVQAIAFRSLRTADTFADFETKFLARIHSLARAHDLLVRQEWSGVNIHDVVKAELAIFDGGRAKRIDVRGDTIALNAAAAQNMALALHELATNAIKSGALSCDAGRVALSWAPAEGGVRVLWQESGAPAVGTPARKGFGTTMLTALFQQAQFDYEPDGLRFSGLMSSVADAHAP
jgi:PAS domain S-box-containing protein